MPGQCRWLHRRDWPEAIEKAWREALDKPRQRVATGRGGQRRQNLPPLAKRSAKFQVMLEEAISCFLGWQIATKRRIHPRLICTAADFEMYADYLEARLAPATAMSRVSGLVIALRVTGATVHQTAAKLILRYLGRKARLALATRQEQAVENEERESLFHLGLAIVEMAASLSAKNPKFVSAAFRDGLLIAWMSMSPARRFNFVDMKVDDLKSDGERTFVIAARQKVAGHDPEVIYLPEELEAAKSEYLAVHRKRLLGAKSDHGMLWVSYRGGGLKGPTMSLAFARRTAPHGRAVRPHALRHRVAQAAGNAERAAQLLGNTPAVVRRNYRRRDRAAAMEVTLAKLDHLLNEASEHPKR